MEKDRPLILVTNDDGFEAAGIWALVEAVLPHGEVVIITPDGPRSAMGHAITMNVPLRIREFESPNGIKYYRTNGTPSDCVKLGQRVVLRDRKIDLVVSGINHGSNSSASLLYSGTMAAAIEASFEGIPAIGFSLLDYSEKADFTAAKIIADYVVKKALAHPFPEHICLNVNIPKSPIEGINGIKITKQAHGYWHEDMVEREDAFGRPYYWLTGHLVTKDCDENACQCALDNHYVSIQPVQFDMTAYKHINDFKYLEQWKITKE
ncbi:5'/3'-nucleotidase SurE [Bacteroidales bacterium OttesenSCG-928-B11]|nr:5'/3'-nucleotidase SurE [Bacteroidales bacterium OttesenSCG-928-B11]